MIISLSKLFNKSLKDAIESPSMKILYQSLDSGERYDIQARIDGIVNELTAFTAGLLMAGLLMISFVKAARDGTNGDIVHTFDIDQPLSAGE